MQSASFQDTFKLRFETNFNDFETHLSTLKSRQDWKTVDIFIGWIEDIDFHVTQLADALEQFNQIQSFSFSLLLCNKHIHEGLIKLFQTISTKKALKHLSFEAKSCNSMREPILLELVDKVAQMTGLFSLSIRFGHCRFLLGDAFVYNFAKVLPNLAILEHLDIGFLEDSSLVDESLEDLSTGIAKLNNLKSLKLTLCGNHLGSYALSSLTNKWTESSKLESFKLELGKGKLPALNNDDMARFFENLAKISTLRNFDIWLDSGVTFEKGSLSFAQMLTKLSNLESLTIWVPSLSTEGLTKLSESLSRNEKLKSFSAMIGHYNLESPSLKEFSQYMKNWPALDNLTINFWGSFSDIPSLSEGIKALKIKENFELTVSFNEEAKESEDLMRSFGELKDLKTLHVHFPTKTNTLKALSEALVKLENLNTFIWDRSVNGEEEGLKALGEALGKVPKLEKVELLMPRGEVTGNSLLGLFNGLSEAKQLKHLKWDLEIGYRNLDPFFDPSLELFGKLKKLEYLEMNLDFEDYVGGPSGFDKWQENLRSRFPQLKLKIQCEVQWSH